MTLNLTLATRWMIVQTSDFKLTVAPGQPPEETAQKQVVLKYRVWSGLLCYTGIAKYPGHDTAQWLTSQLTHSPDDARLPRQIADLLAREGSPWLRRIRAKDRKHTFTLAVFERDRPLLNMISNYQRAGQDDLPQPLDHFIVSRHRPRGPRPYVTGYADCVDAGDKDELHDRLRSERDPHALRRAAAHVSRRSALRSNGNVGENCVSAHLLPNGSGEVQVFGNPAAAFIPTMIMSGRNTATYVPEAFRQAGATAPHRLVGATWTESRDDVNAMLLGFRDVNNTGHSGS